MFDELKVCNGSIVAGPGGKQTFRLGDDVQPTLGRGKCSRFKITVGA
jgi:hypothetical protein